MRRRGCEGRGTRSERWPHAAARNVCCCGGSGGGLGWRRCSARRRRCGPGCAASAQQGGGGLTWSARWARRDAALDSDTDAARTAQGRRSCGRDAHDTYSPRPRRRHCRSAADTAWGHAHAARRHSVRWAHGARRHGWCAPRRRWRAHAACRCQLARGGLRTYHCHATHGADAAWGRADHSTDGRGYPTRRWWRRRRGHSTWLSADPAARRSARNTAHDAAPRQHADAAEPARGEWRAAAWCGVCRRAALAKCGAARGALRGGVWSVDAVRNAR